MKRHGVGRNTGIHVGTFVSERGEPIHSQHPFLAELRRRAESGDASAQNDLGCAYAAGMMAWWSPETIDSRTNLVNYAVNGNTLELYYVNYIDRYTEGMNNSKGAIIRGGATLGTTAHELGHTLGLQDIYASSDKTSFHVEIGAPVRSEWLPNDWSAFYVEELTQATLLTRLLMYGSNDRTGTDISSGPVYGLHYTVVSTNGLLQPVYSVDVNGATGLNSITNRSPVHY